jgi:hypothetical protein
MTINVEDFLSGGGAASAKFPTPGTTVKGTIESAVVQQQTDFATGSPKTWDDGNPMLQLVVTLATDERDDSIDNDDGTRRVFIKGQMRSAVAEAVKLAGAKAVERGATLAIQYKGDGTASKAGFNPPKVYHAQYRSPADKVAEAFTADELI